MTMDGDVFATPRSRAQTEGFATTPASRAPRHRAQSLSEGGYATSAPRRALTPEPARPCRGSAKRSPLKSKSSALDLEMATFFDAEFAASEAAECDGDGGDGASLLDRAPNAKSGRAKRIARWLASGRRPSLRSAPTTRKRRCASWCLAIAGVVGVLQTATVLAMVAPPAAPCFAAPEGGPWRPPLNVYGNATSSAGRRLGAARDEAAPSAKKAAPRKKRRARSRVRQSDLVFWGAHNSYHKQPASGRFPWWNAAVPQWRYSHPRLSRQLDAGARHFELDVHVDSVARTARVFHVPALDARTRCGCLGDCLRSLSDWSRRRNRDHGLVWVLLEVKGTKSYLEDFYARYRGLGDPGSPEASRALGVLDDVARAIFAEFPETLLTPADLEAAGGYPSPGAAVRSEGWPAAERLRGKFALALLDPTHDGALTKAYRSRPSAPMLFSMGAAADDADAALVKFDNPRNVQHFAAIAEAVAAGLIVRTRANTVKFVDNADRFAKARECGAQLVSFEADAGEGWRRFTGEDAGPLCACALPALAGSDRRCDDDAPPCGG